MTNKSDADAVLAGLLDGLAVSSASVYGQLIQDDQVVPNAFNLELYGNALIPFTVYTADATALPLAQRHGVLLAPNAFGATVRSDLANFLESPTRRADLSRGPPLRGDAMKKIIFLALLLPAVALANGYDIPNTSPRDLAMSASVTADQRDAAAAYGNPAALSKIEGLSVNASISYLDLRTKWEGAGVVAGQSPAPSTTRSRRSRSSWPTASAWPTATPASDWA